MTDEVTVNAKDLEIILNQHTMHGHSKPGIWDDSNPKEIAGKPCVECAARERLAALIKPPIPEEPPVDTVLRGKDDLWWRKYSVNDGWVNIGEEYCYTWKQAYEMGADPNRPLVEKADSTKLVCDILEVFGESSGFHHWWAYLDGDKQEAIEARLERTFEK